MKLGLSVNGVMEEITDQGNVDTAAVQETVDLELVEGELININVENVIKRMEVS